MSVRLEICFRRSGDLRYLSHLETVRLWHRALKRAGLPLHYTEGFNPHPKVVFWHALPLGAAAEADRIEVTLEYEVDLAGATCALAEALPPGIEVEEALYVDAIAPRLGRRYPFAVYVFSGPLPADLLAAAELERSLERAGIAYESAAVTAGGAQVKVRLLLDCSGSAPSLKRIAAEVAGFLGCGIESLFIARTGIYPVRSNERTAH